MKALTILLLCASPALAEMTEDQCLALHPEITSPVEMADCTSGEDDAEQALSAAEATLITALPEGEHGQAFADAFGPAQAAWRAWRDAECDLQASGHPGTGGSSLRIQCQADMARARTAEILAFVELWKP